MSSLPGDSPLKRAVNFSSHPGTPKELVATASLANSMDSIKFNESLKIEYERPSNVSMSFTPVETPQIGMDTFGDDFTAKALRNCQKTVLIPYQIFLKIIGWRKFSPSREITPPLHYKIINIVWPVFLLLLLIVSCVTQVMLCFSRDSIKVHHHIHVNTSNNDTLIHVKCHQHLLSTYVLLDFLLIFAYLYGMYIFRVKETEHLATFAETVFLGIISRKGIYSPKNLIRSLQFLMLLGVAWIVYSMLVSILRIFAHRYFTDDIIGFEFIPIGDHPDVLKWVVGVVVVVSIIGFVVFDVAYTAVVINYSIQCQLMVYYLQSISTRIKDREWEIEQSIKEVHSARQFLGKLNSHMSKAMGMMLFIFLTSSFNSIYGLEELKSTDYNVILIGISTALSVVQWLIWLLLPLIQAARVSRSGTWLIKTAMLMRSRPLTYKDTPQLDLDSFLLYCSNVQMKAKLFSVPITPGIVLGGSFVIGFVFYLVFNLSEDSFSWISVL